ncbi:MAG TPA: type I restriction enzyme HsdR N-terminal domain-containing protein [Ignavibacteria bacterium]
MENFDSAFAIVTGLVKDFKENEKRYLSPEYQEAEVRRDFIDKFFEALGWDVYHSKQKNPYEQEVKVEKGVSIGKAQKRADYAFYIAPEFREPKFFTEAKKPSRNLKNADDYFQAVRYGWNANTPVAVLTDFEEFHILDCRIKPNINMVLQNQNHKSYHYTEIFKPDGTYIQKEEDIQFKNAPQKVKEAIKTKYGSYNASDQIEKLTFPDNTTQYLIDIDKDTVSKEVILNSDGQIVCEN